MLLSPGHSPRQIASPSPSPAPSAQSLTAIAAPAAASSSVKRRRQSVLDEDTYVASIEKIIERDYFPDLPRLRDRLDWLEAVRTGDPVVIRDAQLNILERRSNKPPSQATPLDPRQSSALFSATPFGADPTPSNPPPSFQSWPNEEDQIDLSVSLDEFLSKYTSEDNESFSEIIEKVNQRKRDKYAHLLESETDKTEALEYDKRDRITDGFGSSGQPTFTLESWKYTAKNLLMYHSAGEAPLTPEEKAERFKGSTKEINKSNTRFHSKLLSDPEPINETNTTILYSPIVSSMPAGTVARDSDKGRKYDLDDLRKTPNPNPNPYYAESNKELHLQGNGYNFVKTPSPAPGIEESPFMTWGEIEGTPLRLDLEENPNFSSRSPQFKIPLPPARDLKAHFLSRDAAKKIKERKSKLNPKPPLHSSPLRRSGSMSPAGGVRNLSPAAQKFMRNKIGRKSGGVDETLRASYRGLSPSGVERERSRFSRDLSEKSPSVKFEGN